MIITNWFNNHQRVKEEEELDNKYTNITHQQQSYANEPVQSTLNPMTKNVAAVIPSQIGTVASPPSLQFAPHSNNINNQQMNNNNKIPPAPKDIPPAHVMITKPVIMQPHIDHPQNSHSQKFHEINEVVTNYPDQIGRKITLDGNISSPDIHNDDSKDNDINYHIQSDHDKMTSDKLQEKSRIVVVSFKLPIIVDKLEDGSWKIEFKNEQSFLSNLRSLELNNRDKYEVVFVGWPGIFCNTEDQESLEYALSHLSSFRCYPIFLSKTCVELAYDTFCKTMLWPSFHYQLSNNDGGEFGMKYQSSWKAYCDLNQQYAAKACVATEVVTNISQKHESYIWFHDYHLLMAAQFVKKNYYQAKCGLFLHTTFPTSEVFRCLPSRKEILRGMLSNDLLGFHTYDYCRHFLSSCKRILNLDFHTLPIDIGGGATLAIHYLGRDIAIRVSHIGIRSNIIKNRVTLNYDQLFNKIIQKKYLDLYKLIKNHNRRLIVSMGSNDIIHGTLCNLKAFAKFLDRSHDSWRNKVCFVQVLTSSSYSKSMHNLYGKDKNKNGDDIEDSIRNEIESIQKLYDKNCIYLIDDNNLSFNDLIALYSISDVGLFGTFWEGFNTGPYEFTASQTNKDIPGALIISEFMGCHRSLSGVFRINPWNYEEVANTIRTALVMTSQERRISHYRRYNHVMTYTFHNWALGFVKDLKTAVSNTYSNDKQMVSFGDFSNLRLMYVSNDLVKLKDTIATQKLINSFKRCKKRILLFDYGGTLTDTYYTDNPNCIILTKRERERFNHTVSNMTDLNGIKRDEDDNQFDEIIKYLSILASDASTMVGIISGSTREELELAFKKCDKNIMLVSEKGGYFKWPGMEIGDWQKNESLNEASISKWKQIAYDVMKIYCEKCDGSYIQMKSTALVWHYFASDPEYGNMQAVELERYLKRLLDWYHQVTFQRYDHSRLLEILPKGIHKGTAAMTILDNIVTTIEKEKQKEDNKNAVTMGKNDIFMLAVGNDRSDEKMFEALELAKEELNADDNVFTISIGLKPTQSQYYLSNQMDSKWLLQTLTTALQQMYAEQAAKQMEQAQQQQLDDNDDDDDDDDDYDYDEKESTQSLINNGDGDTK